MTGSDAEQFSLRWNNFHSNLTSGFHTLLQEVELVDVTLAAEGQFIQAHKIVLSICSPYFKQLFRINPCKHPIVILKDVSHKELVAILQFMYQGEVNVRQEELSDFLKTAEMLQIKGLTGNDADQETDGNSPNSLPPLPPPRPRLPVRLTEARSQATLPKPKVYTNMQEVSQLYRPRNDMDKLSSSLHDDASLSAPPLKRVRNEPPVSSAHLSQVEGHPKPEFDQRTPKTEPVDLDSDPEENSVHVQHNSLSNILDIHSGESSQSHDVKLVPTGNVDSSPSMLQDATQDTSQAKSGSLPVHLVCYFCGKKMRKTSLKRHIKDCHLPSETSQCQFCNRVFRTANSLQNHLSLYHRAEYRKRNSRTSPETLHSVVPKICIE